MLFLSPFGPEAIPGIPCAIQVAVDVSQIDAKVCLIVFWVFGHLAHEGLQMLLCIIELVHKQSPFSVIILLGDHSGQGMCGLTRSRSATAREKASEKLSCSELSNPLSTSAWIYLTTHWKKPSAYGPNLQ